MDKISIELWVSIVLNLLTLAFFAGVFVTTQKNLKDNLAAFKEEFTKKLDEMKEDFSQKVQGIKFDFTDKLRDLKDNFHEKFETLEKKQDKHNNLIERMAKVEASASSAHKRINGITGDGYDDRS